MQHQAILDQPRGLTTLVLTEMWERFTYYGMRAILILFMVSAESRGGLGMDDRTASSIYGLYIAGTYVLSLFGGWMGDRVIGARQAVIAGGVLILLGNALLALTNVQFFLWGLLIIVFGVGLLKPNISVIVANLYPDGGSRRDAGFSIFFMGINVGALLGGVLVPLCAARFGWRWGFGLPALGMLFGLVQFTRTRGTLGTALSVDRGRQRLGSWAAVLLFIIAIAVLIQVSIMGRLTINPVAMSSAASGLIALLAGGYFVYLIAFAGLAAEERRRVYGMVALFLACVVFYAGSEQAGVSFNLFAERYTDRKVFGWLMPSGILQATTSLYVILFAPIFATVWIALGRRGKDLSTPDKFAVGLALMSVAFYVMYIASQHVMTGGKVTPIWLILTYLLLEWGDLCLTPVGLSSMSALAPRRFVGQMIGVWYLAIGLGNNLAGQLSLDYDASNLQSLPRLFLKIYWLGAIGAAVMLLLSPALKRLANHTKTSQSPTC